MSRSSAIVYNALIRTHHVRSRRKIAALKTAANNHGCAVLLKSDGKPPGIMYVEALSASQVKQWVEAVKKLHYLNYELVSPPSISVERMAALAVEVGVSEVDTVKAFADQMQEKGVYSWWRTAMGYAHGP